MSKNIETKTIGELKDYRFFVPSYQRGYRWTKHEITALFDDISEFQAENDKCYCIQPLIVKYREDGSFEVVDGQQRLTTIFIFMKIAAQEIRSAVPPFSLEYETRQDSASFLKSLSDNGEYIKSKQNNIDYFHMASAYETINAWLDNQQDKSVAIQELNTKIRKSVIFIWYAMPNDRDPIDMFTKVNLGKIPLTSAELIKALLLNRDNFKENENITKRQIEISLAWDRIEQGLRDDSFWYFLNEKEHSGTRIDMLFELLANEYNNALSISITKNQNYFSFLVFSDALNNSESKDEFVNKIWDDIEKLYAEFRDWYADLNKYHIIGYLVASGVGILELFSLTRGKRKSVVVRELLEKAKRITGKTDADSLVNVFYNSGRSQNQQRIRRLLLLFNIATLVCKSEKQYRFPFDIYKGETGDKMKWDIEHIHATADETDESDDSLWNLTLLERGTNRSPEYADKPFNEKRKIILQRESKGLFVPLCTKNVFLKAYSENIIEMEKWSNDDKSDYINAMGQTLENFLEGRFVK